MAALDTTNDRIVAAKIDRDYHTRPTDDWPSRKGRKWSVGSDTILAGQLKDAPKVRFRLLTDDEDVMYGGWLLNDPGCEVQLELLRWGERDVGATIIEIRESALTEWKREIGWLLTWK